jgi:hypothetical protein
MAMRLRIVLKDSEYREIERMARSRRMSVHEWARQALGLVGQRRPTRSVKEKLQVIREAARHNFPIDGLPGNTTLP